MTPLKAHTLVRLRESLKHDLYVIESIDDVECKIMYIGRSPVTRNDFIYVYTGLVYANESVLDVISEVMCEI
jgi:hypothetical protein